MSILPWQDPNSEPAVLALVRQMFGEDGVPPYVFYAFDRREVTPDERAEIIAQIFPGTPDSSRMIGAAGAKVRDYDINIEIHASNSGGGYAIRVRDPKRFACAITVGGVERRVFQLSRPDGVAPFGDSGNFVSFLEQAAA